MKVLVTLAVVAVAAGAVYLMGTDVDVQDSGALPKVNVTTESGRMPDVDVNTPEIDVKMNEKSVTVPTVDVDVDTTERQVEVPEVDFNAAEDSVIDEANEADAVEKE